MRLVPQKRNKLRLKRNTVPQIKLEDHLTSAGKGNGRAIRSQYRLARLGPAMAGKRPLTAAPAG
jgi:hypothetical protein